MKKIVCVLITFAVLVGLITAGTIMASAETYTDASGNVFTYTISNNEVTITGLSESTSTDITIPNSIEGCVVTEIGDCAFRSCTALTSITLPDNLKSIGWYAFQYCSNLKEISIPNEVKDINPYSFNLCENLETINIPASVTYIGHCALEYCYKLSDIDVSTNNAVYCSVDGNLYNKEKTEIIQYAIGKEETFFSIPNGVTKIGDHSFITATNLLNVTLPESLISIGDVVFGDCQNIETINIPDSVTDIGYAAFTGCTNIKQVFIPKNVRTIGSEVFSGSVSLVEINVDAENEYYCSIDGHLYNKAKTELIQYALGKTDTYFSIPNSVVKLNHSSFKRAKNLKTIYIPGSVKTIDRCVFEWCGNLSDVIMKGNVSSIGNFAFSKCTSLKNIYYYGTSETWDDIEVGLDNDDLTSATLHYFEDGDGIILIDKTSIDLEVGAKSQINAFIAPDDTIDKTIVWNSADTNIATVENGNITAISRGTTTISATTANEKFVAKITVSINEDFDGIDWSLDSNGVLIISTTEDMCDFNNTTPPWESKKNEIKEIIFQNGVTRIGAYSFDNYPNLVKVTIPSTVSYIGTDAFFGSWNLKDVYIDSIESWCSLKLQSDTATPLVNSANLYVNNNLVENLIIPEGTTDLGWAKFYGCGSIKKVYFPASLVGTYQMWFTQCFNIEEYVVNSENTKYSSIDGNLCSKDTKTFYQYALGQEKEVYLIPRNVEKLNFQAFRGCKTLKQIILHDNITSIEKSVFNECRALASIVLPNKLTEIQQVNFGSCRNLKTIYIPKSVKKISDYAFLNCTNLTDVYYSGTQEEWEEIEIDSQFNDALNKATIHFNSFPTTWAKVSKDGTSFSVRPQGIENGNLVILALYNGNKFVKLYNAVYQGEDVPFNNIMEHYDQVKIMIWSDFKSLIPLSEVNSSPIVFD